MKLGSKTKNTSEAVLRSLAIVPTAALMAVVSTIALESIVALILPPQCFLLYYLPRCLCAREALTVSVLLSADTTVIFLVSVSQAL